MKTLTFEEFKKQVNFLDNTELIFISKWTSKDGSKHWDAKITQKRNPLGIYLTPTFLKYIYNNNIGIQFIDDEVIIDY